MDKRKEYFQYGFGLRTRSPTSSFSIGVSLLPLVSPYRMVQKTSCQSRVLRSKTYACLPNELFTAILIDFSEPQRVCDKTIHHAIRLHGIRVARKNQEVAV